MKLVTDGLQFPEGPVITADGSILLVEIRRGTLTRVLPGGRHEIVAQLGGGPNGAAIGPDGALYVCNNGGAWEWEPGAAHLPSGPPPEYRGGSIQRVDLRTGGFDALYDSCDGKPLNSPNDLVFDSTGGFWFTTLGFFDGENRRLGGVYYARPDGSRIVRWRSGAEGLVSPNGVGLSPDERMLYVADCMMGRLYEFAIPAPGVMAPQTSMAPGRVVSTLPGFQWLDSLAVEAGGRICVGTLWNGGVTLFEPSGAFEHIPFPDPVTTNICFGGTDMQDAWITCSSTGCLYKVRWPRPGLKLAFNT
jgi:gluconolactonase